MTSQNKIVCQEQQHLKESLTSCHRRDHTRAFFIHHKRPVFIEDTIIGKEKKEKIENTANPATVQVLQRA